MFIHAVVPQRGLPSFEGKKTNFLWEKSGKSSYPTQVRQTMPISYKEK